MKIVDELNKVSEADEKLIDGTGKITKNNAGGDNGLELAFVKIGKEDVAITPNSKLSGFKKFEDMKVGSKVIVSYKKTSRGAEAVSVKKA